HAERVPRREADRAARRQRVGARVELQHRVRGDEGTLPRPAAAANDEDAGVVERGDAEVAPGPGQRRQGGPVRQGVGRTNGGRDDGARGEYLELLDQTRVGRPGTARAADGVEQAVVVNEPLAAEDAARVQLEVVVLVADGTPVQDALVV